MSTELGGAIDVLIKRVDQKAKELAEVKRLVNSLCREAGRDAMYTDADDPLASSTIRPDQYYGKSPVTAAREFLEMKNSAVELEEILVGIGRGGFDFTAQGWTDPDARLRNLAISISKNSTIFHKLPNGFIGLRKFYPDLIEKKAKAAKETPTEGAAQAAKSDATEGKTETANDSNSGE